jgi:predicted acetyltransferase
MNVVPVPVAEKPTLAAMVQAYMEEMVHLVGEPVPAGGYPFFDAYWTAPTERLPYWLRSGHANAGFALVRHGTQSGRNEMAEFFVLPEHRRHGIGLAAARYIIASHPGRWRITQREMNAGAIAFWHRVLDGFVDYEEIRTETDAARREQFFAVD